ncbi:MAG: hypothetical protein ABSC06_29755 [Rhodopila sp.]|jgi:hypothetical protein
MKSMILAAFAALSLTSAGVAHSQAASYHPPQYNYYQNNWMAGGGG